MTNIKQLINAINSDLTTAKGIIYTEEKEIDVKDALLLLTKEVERLQAFEADVDEKEELKYLAETLATEEEGKYSGVKYSETESDGVSVEVYSDYWDFSGGTSHYFYTWKRLRSEFEIRKNN